MEKISISIVRIQLLTVCVVIIFVLGIWAVYIQIIGNRPINDVNSNIPSNFLYQHQSDIIPESYQIKQTGGILMSIETIETDLFKFGNNKIYCKPSNIEAEKINYFNYGSYRYAFVCGNNYWIVNGITDTPPNTMTGMIYGPFKI